MGKLDYKTYQEDAECDQCLSQFREEKLLDWNWKIDPVRLLLRTLLFISLILTLVKQKDNFKPVHITSIVGMSLLALFMLANTIKKN